MLNRKMMNDFITTNDIPLKTAVTQKDFKRFFNKYYNSVAGPTVDYGLTPNYIEIFNWDSLKYLLKNRYKVCLTIIIVFIKKLFFSFS